jgi:hypothetical protein
MLLAARSILLCQSIKDINVVELALADLTRACVVSVYVISTSGTVECDCDGEDESVKDALCSTFQQGCNRVNSNTNAGTTKSLCSASCS